MAGSFQRYGQLAPLVACLREETHEILDGFKRLAAARALGGTEQEFGSSFEHFEGDTTVCSHPGVSFDADL
jgi:hypothetical protein